MRKATLLAALVSVFSLTASAQTPNCSACAEWNRPQKPFRIFGNTYYVGPHGLSSILITSDRGHVLVDGGLPESAAIIAANIKALGFKLEDVKLILNSHDHFDHAGGVAELQRLTHANVIASPSSARVLESGQMDRDDPQYGAATSIPKVSKVAIIRDGDTVHSNALVLTAHFTPGHTAGGTSWSWDSCETSRCLHIVYADSLTAVSAPGYKFSQHPAVVANFEKSFAMLDALPCDILLTPHPDFSNLWARVAARDAGKADAFVDAGACRRYAQTARTNLAAVLAKEKP